MVCSESGGTPGPSSLTSKRGPTASVSTSMVTVGVDRHRPQPVAERQGGVPHVKQDASLEHLSAVTVAKVMQAEADGRPASLLLEFGTDESLEKAPDML